MSHHDAWKAWERKACRDMGGQRKPQLGPEGWARGSDDDGSIWCSLECKYVTRYQLRHSWVEQSRRQGKADGRPWAIGMREHYERHSGLFICDWDTGVELVYSAGRIPLGRGVSG